MTREFDCIECGRRIVSFGLCPGADHSLCGMCLVNPGWFKIAAVRAVVDPDHDGLDAVERLQSKETR
ncbi:hypothetical protein [Methylocystis sp. S23]